MALANKTTLFDRLSHSQYSVQGQLTSDVKSIIRKKINSYIHSHLELAPQQSKQSVAAKKFKPSLPKQFPEYNSLVDILRDEKTLLHLYKQKIQRNLDESAYFFFKVFNLAIDYDCEVSQKQIDKESSVMVDAFLFLASSLLEVGTDKAAFYFATIGVQYCEYIKTLHPIGQFLLILAKISRKHFRYKESILMLKKGLEYNWWKDSSKSDQLNGMFIEWLTVNCPDEQQVYRQKYQVVRIFTQTQSLVTSMKSYRSAQGSKDLDLGVFRELFQQFMECSRIRLESICYDIGYRKHREINHNREHDLEIEIYNELSFNFLQLNMKQQSKLFAEKYESGYIQPQDSKIISLSCQLIHSVQKRISGWHRVDRKMFGLLFYVDTFEVVNKNRSALRTPDQDYILQLFKINYERSFDNFLQKEMFQYEIPLPLEIRRGIAHLKKKKDGAKFIVKQRSISHMGKVPTHVIKSKKSSQKVEQNVLLNFRGVGVSRLKLVNILNQFLAEVKQREQHGCFKLFQ